MGGGSGAAAPVGVRGGPVLQRAWVHLIVTAVGYAGLTWVGTQLIPSDGPSSFWPAAGFSAVMLLWAGTRRLRALTLVAVAAAYLVQTLVVGSSFGWPLEWWFLVANVLEPLVVLPFLLRATRVEHSLTNLQSLGWLLLGSVAGAATSAFVATAGAVVVGQLEPVAADLGNYWRDWAAGDALGLLVVVPLLLQTRPLSAVWSKGSPVEQVAVWLLFAVSALQLGRPPSITMLLLAGVILVALRLSTAAASLAIFLATLWMMLLALAPSMLSGFAQGGLASRVDVRLIIFLVAVLGQAVALSTAARETALAQRDAALASADASLADARASEHTLRGALDAGLDPFAVFQRARSGRWRLLFANEAARGARDTPIGAGVESIIPAEALDVVGALMDRAEETGEVQQALARFRSGGSPAQGDFDVACSPAREHRMVVTWRDVTEVHAAQRNLRTAHAAALHAATHDALTNLPNRVLLDDRLELAAAALRRTKDSLAVVYVDLDDFKDVNDRHGHTAGDAVLIEVSRRLASLVRASDTVARLGGDEFVLLLTGVDHGWSAEDFHLRLLAELGRPIVVAGVRVRVRASAGVVVVTGEQHDALGLVDRADAAMYRSKTSGKGVITRYVAGMEVVGRMPLPAEADLRAALQQDQFLLHYQPVIDTATRGVVGYEALIRWQHPVHGLVPPDQFLGIAEVHGLMEDIGHWVLRRAVADLRALPGDPWMSVNLAPSQLVRRDLRDDVESVLRDAGVPARRLVLEIAESQLLEASSVVLGRLDALRALGARVALDDFGSGYSSLAYLETFALDIVKLDRALLDGDISPRKRAFMDWLGKLAPTIDVVTILEGVETEEQFALARDAGVQMCQGYLLGRPAPLEQHLSR